MQSRIRSTEARIKNMKAGWKHYQRHSRAGSTWLHHVWVVSLTIVTMSSIYTCVIVQCQKSENVGSQVSCPWGRVPGAPFWSSVTLDRFTALSLKLLIWALRSNTYFILLSWDVRFDATLSSPLLVFFSALCYFFLLFKFSFLKCPIYLQQREVLSILLLYKFIRREAWVT